MVYFKAMHKLKNNKNEILKQSLFQKTIRIVRIIFNIANDIISIFKVYFLLTLLYNNNNIKQMSFMMPTLYVITGLAGVGKSTISRRIAESKKISALIEGDNIYHQVVGGYIQACKKVNHLSTFGKVCLNSIENLYTIKNTSMN